MSEADDRNARGRILSEIVSTNRRSTRSSSSSTAGPTNPTVSRGTPAATQTPVRGQEGNTVVQENVATTTNVVGTRVSTPILEEDHMDAILADYDRDTAEELAQARVAREAQERADQEAEEGEEVSFRVSNTPTRDNNSSSSSTTPHEVNTPTPNAGMQVVTVDNKTFSLTTPLTMGVIQQLQAYLAHKESIRGVQYSRTNICNPQGRETLTDLLFING